jgi:hypothetical protein
VEDDDTGLGWFVFYVTGSGYAAAEIDGDEVIEQIRGKPVRDARAQLQAELPLAEPPQFVTWPKWPETLTWLERVPLIPLRVDVHVTPQVQDVEDAAASLPSGRWRGLVEGVEHLS